ncbi:MAG: MATE family efflux transporter [Terrimicrobiaceae bacterium]
MSLLTQSLSENRRTLALAAPIAAGHVSQMLMGLADTVMVGNVGVVPLAACAFANTVLMIPFIFGFGLLAGVSVRASHAFGAGRAHQCGEVLRAGAVMAAVIGTGVALAVHAGIPLLPWLGQPPEVNAACVNYLLLCGWSVVPVYLTTVAKNLAEALARPWVPFWLMIGGVLINVALNWVLIYGNLGAPRMGLDGAGLATLLARVITAILMFSYVLLSPALRISRPVKWLAGGLWPEMRPLLAIGLPAGTMHLSEVSGFAFGSLMMGWLGINAMAAHQIAITCAGTTFMIPLGLSQAVSVRVGHSRGAGEAERCRPIIFGALGLAVVIMAGFAVMFLTAGTLIAGWFVAAPAIVLLAARLMRMAAWFQIFDGIQIVCSGALRGFEDARMPMIIGILAYWVVALPVSYVSAFRLGSGAEGVWFGFVMGLAVAATALFIRVLLRLKQTGM